MQLMQSQKFELDNTTIDNNHPLLHTILYATQEDQEKVCNFRVLLQLFLRLPLSFNSLNTSCFGNQQYETENEHL